MELTRILNRALCVLVALYSMTATGAGTAIPKGGLWAGKTTVPWAAGQVDALALIAENGHAYFAVGNVIYRGSGAMWAGGLFGGYLLNGEASQGMPTPHGFLGGSWYVVGGATARQYVGASVCPSYYGWMFDSPVWCLRYPAAWRLNLAYQASYDDNSSLARIAGTYRESHGFLTGVLSIASNGRLFLQDPASGCVLNGQVAVINPDFNAYDFQFSYANCKDAKLNGAKFSGLATYRASTRQLMAMGQAFPRAGLNVRMRGSVYVFSRL
jgi:hypothetical protein